MRLLNYLYWSQPGEYTSNYPLPDAVSRLKGLVHSGFIPRAGVSGRVSERKVQLYRVIPLWANSFAPVFVGKFESVNGKIVLSGFYSIHFAVKTFMTIWFAITLFGALVVLACLATGIIPPENAIFVLIPFGMFAFGLVLIKMGQLFSRGDIEYIRNVIGKALEDR